MASNYYKEVTARLSEAGGCILRQGKGSHEIWTCPHAKNPVSVPTKIKSRHTANKILKDAGIDEKI